MNSSNVVVRSFVFVAALFLFVGCGSENNYRSECLRNRGLGVPQLLSGSVLSTDFNVSRQYALKLDGDEFTLTQEIFKDNRCSEAQATYTFTGTTAEVKSDKDDIVDRRVFRLADNASITVSDEDVLIDINDRIEDRRNAFKSVSSKDPDKAIAQGLTSFSLNGPHTVSGEEARVLDLRGSRQLGTDTSFSSIEDGDVLVLGDGGDEVVFTKE